MRRNTTFSGTVARIALVASILAHTAYGAGTIQQMIDAAADGAVVSVPEGHYRGAIVLRDGITLVGAGAETTTIDGEGAARVVVGGRDSAIVGFTIRNGKVGVANDRAFIGVFDCHIVDYTDHGVRLDNGSAVIANNRISGTRRTIGVYCIASNPLIANNRIESNGIGIAACRNYHPTAMDNVLAGNATEIFQGSGATVSLADASLEIAEPGDGQETAVGDVAEYRRLMDMAFVEKVAQHPVVTYDLGDVDGEFSVATRFPWTTFNVASATTDTRIASHQARDDVLVEPLASTLLPVERPTVAVTGEDSAEEAWGRYLLDQEYSHPESYYEAAEGARVFSRETSFSNIEVLIPAGYEPVAISHPAVLDCAGERTVVSIVDVGLTKVEIVMAPVR